MTEAHKEIHSRCMWFSMMTGYSPDIGPHHRCQPALGVVQPSGRAQLQLAAHPGTAGDRGLCDRPRARPPPAARPFAEVLGKGGGADAGLQAAAGVAAGERAAAEDIRKLRSRAFIQVKGGHACPFPDPSLRFAIVLDYLCGQHRIVPPSPNGGLVAQEREIPTLL